MKIGRVATYLAGIALAAVSLTGCNKPTGFGGDVGGLGRECNSECRKNADFDASLDAFYERYGRIQTTEDTMDYVPYERPCWACPERPVPPAPKN